MNHLFETGKQMLAVIATQQDTIGEQAREIESLKKAKELADNWYVWHNELKERYDALLAKYEGVSEQEEISKETKKTAPACKQ